MNNMHKNIYIIFVFIFSLFLCNSCSSTDERFSTTLWLENKNVAIDAYNTPFVKDLKAGTLKLNTFEYYLYQDIYYLQNYSYAAGIAAQYAVDAEAKADLETRGSSSQKYVDDTIEYFKNLSLVYVPNKYPMNSVTLSYINFLTTTARTKATVYYFASITPCSRLYAYLGRTIYDTLTPEQLKLNKYKKWIVDNSHESAEPPSPPSDTGDAGLLESFVDRLSQNLTSTEREEVKSIYKQGFEHELEFFTAPTIKDQIVMNPLWKTLNVFNNPLVF